MKHTRARLTALFTLTFVLSPLVTPPFSGFRADQLPIPQVDPPVQPAGWAFSIWGVIYLWLVVSALWGLWKRSADAGWNVAREPLAACLAIGTFWLWVAGLSAIGATVMIFVMMALAVGAAVAAPRATAEDRWLFEAPVALLAGWLTAASFVSLGATAAGYGLVTGPVGWAVIALCGALAVGVTVQRRIPRTPAYGAALAWALVGVAVKNAGDVTGVAALAVAGVVLIAGVLALGRGRQAVAG